MQILNKAYFWHKVPAKVKAKAVILYFRGLSLRDVQNICQTKVIR